jgi:hypothetical protein
MRPSRGTAGVAVGLVVLAAVLAVVAAVRGPMPLPVVALLGGGLVPIATMEGRAAVLVPLVLVAVVAGVRASGRLPHASLWAQLAAAPILLVGIARLNGVADAPALVLVYAATAGDVLLRFAHTRSASPLPLRLAAGLGVVPWGVVAFAQVGGLLVGAPPPVAVRVLTVVVLAAAVLQYVVAYRRRDAPERSTQDLLLVAIPCALAALLVVATVG